MGTTAKENSGGIKKTQMWHLVNSGAGLTVGLMILDVFSSPSGSGSILLNGRSREDTTK